MHLYITIIIKLNWLRWCSVLQSFYSKVVNLVVIEQIQIELIWVYLSNQLSAFHVIVHLDLPLITNNPLIQGLTSPRRPLRVQTDQGKEFYNRGVQAWFKKQGTHHFSTYGDSKASVVERWHRTLKQRMYRYFTAHNTLRYVDVLQPLIHTYNHAYHRSIGSVSYTHLTLPTIYSV